MNKHVEETLEAILVSIQASALNAKAKRRVTIALGKAQHAAAVNNRKGFNKAVNEICRELLK